MIQRLDEAEDERLRLQTRLSKFESGWGLADAIKENQSLTKLNLANNKLVCKEAGAALGAALAVNTALKELIVSDQTWYAKPDLSSSYKAPLPSPLLRFIGTRVQRAQKAASQTLPKGLLPDSK